MLPFGIASMMLGQTIVRSTHLHMSMFDIKLFPTGIVQLQSPCLLPGLMQ